MTDFYTNITDVSNALKPKIALHILLLNTCTRKMGKRFKGYPHSVASQLTEYILEITDLDSFIA
jgi:hypothetical protein